MTAIERRVLTAVATAVLAVVAFVTTQASAAYGLLTATGSASHTFTVAEIEPQHGDVCWAIDANGLMIVAPTMSQARAGRTIADGMADSFSSDKSPNWLAHHKDIKSVEVVGGVRPTSLRQWFFYGTGSTSTSFPKLTTVDLSGMDFSQVTSMESMFNNCQSLTSVTFGSTYLTEAGLLDTSKVKSVKWMFSRCGSLRELDLSNFDTSSLTNMYAMCIDCTKLESLDLTSWKTERVTSMYNMLSDCSSLAYLRVGGGWVRSSRDAAKLPRAMYEANGTQLKAGSVIETGAHTLTYAKPATASQEASLQVQTLMATPVSMQSSDSVLEATSTDGPNAEDPVDATTAEHFDDPDADEVPDDDPEAPLPVQDESPVMDEQA